MTDTQWINLIYLIQFLGTLWIDNTFDDPALMQKRFQKLIDGALTRTLSGRF